MLAPLKDRSILSRSGDTPSGDGEAQLRHALRQARQALRHAAALGARQSVAQINEINRLQEQNRLLSQRLDELESGQAIVSLGRSLMSLRAENDTLKAALVQICQISGRRIAAREHMDWPSSAPPRHQP